MAAAVIYAFLPGSHWLWALPLFVVAFLVGGFPLRRTLYGETWSAAAYVRYTLFSFVGAAGFWLSLAFAPLLIFALVHGWAPGTSPVQGAAIIGVLVALALAAWEYAYPLLWLGLHRASPLERADLTSRFDDIIRRSTVASRPPRVFRYGVPGAYVMNAVALPSTRQPRVAFGDSLLELLAPDEIAAVFAHEVAHLEHFDRRRVTWLRAITYLLVLGATALPAVMFATTPTFAWTVKLLWPIIVIVLLLLRIAKSQAHETESDLRAGVLTGDPEAMVRALTKLHHYSRMPRRWPYDFERAASHPSLARRIQALRTQGAAAAAPPAAAAAKLGAPTVLRSTEPGTYAALDDTRAYWFEGVPADVTVESMAELREHATSYRAVAYTDLTELRVAVVRAGGRMLLARDRSGKTWSIPLRADDVASAQQALDVLDVRLSTHVREDWAMKARAAATLLALALVGAMDFSWSWFPLILTLVKPSAASLAAMGSMVIARVVLGALAGTLGASALGGTWPAAWLSVAAMVGIGMWACRLAWRWARAEERPTTQPLAIVAVAIAAILPVSALAITTYGGSIVAPVFSSSQEPAAALAIPLLGVGAAILTYRDKLRRRSGAVLCVLALALGGVGVDGHRLFTRGIAKIAWTPAQAEVTGRVTLSGHGHRLELSPTGQRFAVQSVGRRPARYADAGHEQWVSLWRFTIGSVAGARRTAEAFELTFLDDEHVLLLRPSPTSADSLDLSVERADGGDSRAPWRLAIPAYYAPTLMVSRAAGTWRVTGYDVDASAIVTSVGRIGSDSVTTTKLAGGLVGGRPLHTYRDGTSLVATLPGWSGPGTIFLSMLGIYPFRWNVWHVVNGERRSMGALPGLPECGGTSERDEALLCVVRGRSRVTLWRLGTRERAGVASLGALPPGFDLWDIGADGRVAAASHNGSTLAVIDAGLGRGKRIALGGAGGTGGTVQLQGAPAGSAVYATDVAVASDMVAVLVARNGNAEVTFYRVN